MKLTLSRPVSYKDTELHELDVDLDTLTGNDLITAENNFRRANPDGQLFGSVHMLYIAARACSVPAETLKALNARDYMRLVNEVYAFFGNTDSEASAPEITDD